MRNRKNIVNVHAQNSYSPFVITKTHDELPDRFSLGPYRLTQIQPKLCMKTNPRTFSTPWTHRVTPFKFSLVLFCTFSDLGGGYFPCVKACWSQFVIKLWFKQRDVKHLWFLPPHLCYSFPVQWAPISICNFLFLSWDEILGGCTSHQENLLWFQADSIPVFNAGSILPSTALCRYELLHEWVFSFQDSLALGLGWVNF